MNILDENIPVSQRTLLHRRRIAVRQIGFDLGRQGLSDEGLIPFLLTLRRPTFFTRDHDFYRPRLCHARYCLVWLDVGTREVADYVRRLLRHPELDTQAKRMGSVIGVSPNGLSVWRLRAEQVTLLLWTTDSSSGK